MAEVIVRDQEADKRIYIKDVGQIKLHDMSLDGGGIHKIVVDSLYHELHSGNSLNPPFKKIEIDEGLLTRILSLSKDPRKPDKHKEIEYIQRELQSKYSLNFA